MRELDRNDMPHRPEQVRYWLSVAAVRTNKAHAARAGADWGMTAAGQPRRLSLERRGPRREIAGAAWAVVLDAV